MTRNKINGIVLCAQGILMEIAALYSLVPIFAGILSKDIYLSSDDEALFTFGFWLVIWGGSTIVIAIGKSKVVSGSSNGQNPESLSVQTPVYSVNNEQNQKVWYCPKCGKQNQDYVSICGCGTVKPK